MEQDRTANSFGFEWSKFTDVFPGYERNFMSYITPLGPSFFQGKRVMDAGCGAGRHTVFASRFGARNVTAFDLSDKAVETTRRNTAGLAVLVEQSDIYHLPHKWLGKFDFIMCIGVLHHLPDPQEGFRRLIPMLHRGGAISIWVYGTDDNRLARCLYDPMRKVTTRLPHRLLYWMSLPPAMVVDAANRMRLPVFQHYRCLPFRTKWNDAFDVLSAPSVRYYSIEDIQRWFTEAGLQDIRVSHRMLGKVRKGVIGFGVRL